MDALSEYVDKNWDRYLQELVDLVQIPSISALPEHKPDVRRCAEALVQLLRGAGITQVEIVETGGNPVVYGAWLEAPGAPTALVYGHYDVQPVDPLDEWEHPPFSGLVRDGIIYGRGTADDKGQVLMHVKAAE